MAAMMLNTSSQNCIAAPRAPPGDGTPPYHPAKLSGLRLAQIRFASGFHRRRDRILFVYRNFLAALDQLVRAFPQFAGFLLRVILALVGFFRQKIARLLAGLRRTQN